MASQFKSESLLARAARAMSRAADAALEDGTAGDSLDYEDEQARDAEMDDALNGPVAQARNAYDMQRLADAGGGWASGTLGGVAHAARARDRDREAG